MFTDYDNKSSFLGSISVDLKVIGPIEKILGATKVIDGIFV